jgi:hypothetical protein
VRPTTLNFFGIGASQPLSEWRRTGWIHPADPRGWFQWYCRYYLGRRLPEEDARQIKRWKAIRRHVLQVQRNCERGDLTCGRRHRQALLHWAYDNRKINPVLHHSSQSHPRTQQGSEGDRDVQPLFPEQEP